MKAHLLIVSSLMLASPLALAQGTAKPATPAQPGAFEALDLNGDGKLAREEASDPSIKFAELDRDKDGMLSRSEYEAGMKPKAAPADKPRGSY